MDEPVEVVDNGVRSFIPPTFCFELRRGGRLVQVVSHLVVAAERGRGLADFEALALAHGSQLLATGEVVEHDEGPTAQVPGRRFTIEGWHEAP